MNIHIIREKFRYSIHEISIIIAQRIQLRIRKYQRRFGQYFEKLK
ncbi:hypothetical protein pb186bvf_012422 [Paramecium bursaria]